MDNDDTDILFIIPFSLFFFLPFPPLSYQVLSTLWVKIAVNGDMNFLSNLQFLD